MNNAILTYNANECKPMWNDTRPAVPMGVKMSSNLRLLAGTILACLTSAATNEVQRLTGTATGGETYLEIPGWGISTTKIGALATAAQVKACLETVPGLKGSISTSSGPLGTNPVDITFNNRLAGLPQEQIRLFGSTLTGGTITPSTVTEGVANGRWVQADLTKLADPTTGPSVSTTTGGTFAVGAYACQMAWVTAQGETLPSQASLINIPDATNDAIRFAAINAANTPDEATAIKYYINGILAATVAVATGAIAQTDVLNMPTSGQGTGPASVNTAYTVTDGRHVPAAILRFDVATTPSGEVVLGSAPTGQHGVAQAEAPTWIGGYFMASEIVGLTAEILAAMNGRIVKGSLSDPTTCVVNIPS